MFPYIGSESRMKFELTLWKYMALNGNAKHLPHVTGTVVRLNPAPARRIESDPTESCGGRIDPLNSAAPGPHTSFTQGGVIKRHYSPSRTGTTFDDGQIRAK